MPKIFKFLNDEWTNSEIEENKHLVLRSKILNILSEIILKQGIKIEALNLYLSIISSSLSASEISELYLIEV